MKDKAKYLCPKCRTRVRVLLRGTELYWENHSDKNGKWCDNAGQRVAGSK